MCPRRRSAGWLLLSEAGAFFLPVQLVDTKVPEEEIKEENEQNDRSRINNTVPK